MYESLGDFCLKSGESVEMGVIYGPDLDWAERLETLLAHKGNIWDWQNSAVLRRQIGIDGRFYVLHRDGEPFANMMVVVQQGSGHFGHVWTCPEDRRQGAATGLMEHMMEHFRQSKAKALFLGTGFDSPAYHIYRHHGFRGIEAQSGNMEYYVHDKTNFEAHYFAKEQCSIEALNWCHWPASAALFLADIPGRVRCLTLGLLGRSSTEGPMLNLLQQNEYRAEQEHAISVRVLVQNISQAVVGMALWSWDKQWPGTCLIDVYCHPHFWDQATDLLAALEIPEAERYVAYGDLSCKVKDQYLEAHGFQQTGTLAGRIALDKARLNFADVSVWEKYG